tara:strand:- start:369 stop:1613 length:1245 start_codon:yes stop_codon:yes gene_type:complete
MVNSKVISSLSQIMIMVAILGVGIYGSVLWVHWDDINVLEKPGNNEENGITYVTMDLPLGTLLYVETITTAVLLVISALGLFASGNENTRAVLLVFNSLFFSAFAFTFAYRAFTLWGTSEGQCGYIGEGPDYIKSCPVTRHLNSGPDGINVEPFYNISHIEPEEKNDCIFWFWDQTFPYESVTTEFLGGSGSATSLVAIKEQMRNTMDWSKRAPYGWYEIDAGCSEGTTGGQITGATDCIQDGRSVFAGIESETWVTTPCAGADDTPASCSSNTDCASGEVCDQNVCSNPNCGQQNGKILITNTLPRSGTDGIQKPDISFCWYWGCNKHCNHERYIVNQLLLWVSLTMTVFTLFTTLLSGSYAAGKWDVIMPGGAGAAKGPGEEEEKDESNWKNMEIGESGSGILKKRSRQLRF